MAYDNENLRRLINSKVDEIKLLSDKINELNTINGQLLDKIERLERLIEELEDKNKKLVELLNANIYNKAENYKEKVLSKL